MGYDNMDEMNLIQINIDLVYQFIIRNTVLLSEG